MSEEIALVFQELFYGSGIWLGILLLLTIVTLLSLKNKLFGILTIPISIFMGIDYLTLEGATSIHYWSALIFFLASIFIMVNMMRNKE